MNKEIKDTKYLKKEFNERMLSRILLEITEFCDLKCLNCNRSCGQAPSTKRMTIEQVKKFVDDSIKLNWDWKRIAIVGGESTTHPNLIEIINEVKRYKDINQEIMSINTINKYMDQDYLRNNQ